MNGNELESQLRSVSNELSISLMQAHNDTQSHDTFSQQCLQVNIAYYNESDYRLPESFLSMSDVCICK